MDSRQSYKHMLSALDSRPLQHADCPLLLTSLYPLGEKGACRHHPTKLERLGESARTKIDQAEIVSWRRTCNNEREPQGR